MRACVLRESGGEVGEEAKAMEEVEEVKWAGLGGERAVQSGSVRCVAVGGGAWAGCDRGGGEG